MQHVDFWIFVHYLNFDRLDEKEWIPVRMKVTFLGTRNLGRHLEKSNFSCNLEMICNQGQFEVLVKPFWNKQSYVIQAL